MAPSFGQARRAASVPSQLYRHQFSFPKKARTRPRTTDCRNILLCVVGVLLAVAGCATAPLNKTAVRIEGVFDRDPTILSRAYSPDQREQVAQLYRSNPEAHSQIYGNMLLSQFAAKNSEFAHQLNKLPDLRDGINANEAHALQVLYEYIKGLEFPPAFAKRKVPPQNERAPEMTVVVGDVVDGVELLCRALRRTAAGRG